MGTIIAILAWFAFVAVILLFNYGAHRNGRKE